LTWIIAAPARRPNSLACNPSQETAVSDALRDQIVSILKEGQDLTLATLRPDGWPQATTVSYASDGTTIYFGTGANAQKARNVGRDDRVSVTVTLGYPDWNSIRGLSLAGRARRITDPAEMARIGGLFMAKFKPEMLSQAVPADAGDMALFQITPTVVSVLDYSKGFGHTDLVELTERAAA
jgi:hypothetical protein